MSEFNPRPLMTVSPMYRPWPTLVNSVFDFRNTGLPPQQDFLFLHNRVGLYPTAGPHMLIKDPSLLGSHLEKLRADIEKAVPKKFEGNIILDFDIWSPLWRNTRNDCDGTEFGGCGDYDDNDYDFQDDWVETWEEVNPEKCSQWKSRGKDLFYNKMATTYEMTVAEFFTETIRAIREVRPQAKIGVLGHIYGPYMPDGSENAEYKDDNADMYWLYEEVDLLVPRIPFELDRNIDEEQGVLLSDYRKLIDSILKETWEIALAIGDNKKEIFPFYPMQFSNRQSPHFGKMLLSPIMQTALDQAYSNSCHGCYLWYGLASDKNVADVKKYMQEHLKPSIEALDDGIYIEPKERYEDFPRSKPRITEEKAEAQSAFVEDKQETADDGYTASEDFSAFFGKEGITFTIPYEAIRRHFL